MGDTQRSQTMSAQNHIMVEQATHKTNSAKPTPGNNGKPLRLMGEVSLNNIAMLAKNNLEMTFTSVAHRIDQSLLREAFSRIEGV